MYKEKTMADKKVVLRILAVALVFGLFVVGCNTDVATWKNVTDLNDVAGTWKASYSKEYDFKGLDLATFIGQIEQETATVLVPVEDGDEYFLVEMELPIFDEDGDPVFVEYTALDDVTVKEVGTITEKYTATTTTTGTRETTVEWTRTYDGDSLDQVFGYDVSIDYDDPDNVKTVRTGWELIKAAVAGGFAAPYSLGYTVDDTNHSIKFKTPTTTPTTLALSYFTGALYNGSQLVRGGNLYTK